MACRSHAAAAVAVALAAVLCAAGCTREPTRNRGGSGARASSSASPSASPANWGDAGAPSFANQNLLGAPLGTPPSPTGRWALELRNYSHSFFGMERTSDVETHASVVLDLAPDGSATGCFGEFTKHISIASPYVTQDKKWEHSEYENKGGTTQFGSWRLDGPWLELRFDAFSHDCPATVRRPGGTTAVAGGDAGPADRFPNGTPWVLRCATVPARAPAPALLLACTLPAPTLWQAFVVPVGPTRTRWLLLGRDPGLRANLRTTTWIPQPPKDETLELTSAVNPISPGVWSRP